jgi:hypothetical protein
MGTHEKRADTGLLSHWPEDHCTFGGIDLWSRLPPLWLEVVVLLVSAPPLAPPALLSGLHVAVRLQSSALSFDSVQPITACATIKPSAATMTAFLLFGWFIAVTTP